MHPLTDERGYTLHHLPITVPGLRTELQPTSTLSPSLIYPTLAIASIAITTLFSTLVFKEKIYWWQWVGVFVGTVAVVLLSI